MQQAKAGMIFEHARILTEAGTPARCVVTAVRQGCIYYATEGETKSKEYTTLERWAKVCKTVVNP